MRKNKSANSFDVKYIINNLNNAKEEMSELISKMDLADGEEDFSLMYYSNKGEDLEKLYFIYSME